MSEALYVCTGDGAALSHYGLGVDRYTHFTSPIRRYADVVVHKQLLASLELERAGTTNAAMEFVKPDRPALATVPDSNVISILAGEGADVAITQNENFIEDDPDDFLDSLIDGASELVLGVTDDTASGSQGMLEEDATANVQATAENAEMASEVDNVVRETNESILRPYTGPEVTRIADSLNKQNRMAKFSSRECQSLFLSLYFRDHEEATQGVVTDLRENGCIVYIPKVSFVVQYSLIHQ